jgi:hypothetical protein
MPGNDVTVTATYKPIPTYALTVVGGTGGGNFASGVTVTVTAGTAPAGQVFDKWTSSPAVTFANANSASTTFTMPAGAVTVTATYKAAPTGDDEGSPGGLDTTTIIIIAVVALAAIGGAAFFFLRKP